MRIIWKIFTDAGSIQKAEKVVNSAIKQIGIIGLNLNVEPYHKGGFICSFESAPESDDWSCTVLNTINFAQKIAHSYILNGNILNELDMWSNESSVSGVTNMQVITSKKV